MIKRALRGSGDAFENQIANYLYSEALETLKGAGREKRNWRNQKREPPKRIFSPVQDAPGSHGFTTRYRSTGGFRSGTPGDGASFPFSPSLMIADKGFG